MVGPRWLRFTAHRTTTLTPVAGSIGYPWIGVVFGSSSKHGRSNLISEITWMKMINKVSFKTKIGLEWISDRKFLYLQHTVYKLFSPLVGVLEVPALVNVCCSVLRYTRWFKGWSTLRGSLKLGKEKCKEIRAQNMKLWHIKVYIFRSYYTEPTFRLRQVSLTMCSLFGNRLGRDSGTEGFSSRFSMETSFEPAETSV
jgi:hypothetical protein